VNQQTRKWLKMQSYYYYHYISLMAFFPGQPGLACNRHQTGKPFWILLQQEMTRWQRHQLDHMQIICTSIQTDNHADTSPLSFLRAGCPSSCPTNSVKALKAKLQKKKTLNLATAYQ